MTVTDYAAGAGGTLLGVGTALRKLGYSPILRGLEINERVAGWATAVLAIAGFDSDIRVGDSLIDDEFHAAESDITLAQPPFGLRVQHVDAVRARHRQGWYTLGIPGPSDATWLFAQRVIDGLGGAAGIDRGVCFVGPGSLRGLSSSAIRESLLERGLLAAIVALPEGLTQASVPTFALIFEREQPEPPRSHVRAVDLRGASQATTLREIRRQLNGDAEDTLLRALNSKNDGPSWRTVPVAYFLNQNVRVRTGETPVSEGWEVEVPRHDPEVALRTRYGPVPVVIERAVRTTCAIAVDPVFDRAADGSRQWMLDNGWEATRLSALLAQPPRVAQPGSAVYADSNTILLPTTPRLRASALEDPPADAARRLQLELDTSRVDADFVVAWLNSEHGRVVRAKAVESVAIGTVIRAVRSEPRQLWRLCDEILVPLPRSEVQREIVRAESRIGTAAAMLADSRQEVWDNPASAMEVARRVEPLLDKSLETWAGDLPFPVASALWAFRTKQDLHGAHRHVFHVWEAYTIFLATVLMSALAQDPVRETDQRDKLTRTLEAANLSLDRASFGCWSTIVQSLSSDFRIRLASGDPDDETAVLSAFGGASQYSLERVLSPRSVALIADANKHRNVWSGHAGAVADSEIRKQIDYMTEGLEQLREITGNAWADLPLVRAGHADLRSDDVLVQRAELVCGTRVPFQQVDLQVGQIMKRDQLYICNDGATRPLPLKHSVVLRSSPDTAQYTSYFYSRREGEDVRLVTYALAEASERFEPSTELPMDFITW